MFWTVPVEKPSASLKKPKRDANAVLPVGRYCPANATPPHLLDPPPRLLSRAIRNSMYELNLSVGLMATTLSYRWRVPLFVRPFSGPTRYALLQVTFFQACAPVNPNVFPLLLS